MKNVLVGEKRDLETINEENDETEKHDDVLDIYEIPQAFTHFTYVHSNQELMVCDLQGVLDVSQRRFELTDPVVHSATLTANSDTTRCGRKGIFGRTDCGKVGMQNFFETHACGVLCKLLQLSEETVVSSKKPPRKRRVEFPGFAPMIS